MAIYRDLTGQRFGRLTVQGRTQISSHNTKWKCVCDCGNVTVVTSQRLLGQSTGKVVSCGCYFREHLSEYGRLGANAVNKQRAQLKKAALALQIFRAGNGEYHFIDLTTGLDAYGSYIVDGDQPLGALTHAPTQESMDRISAILDVLPDALFVRMLSSAINELKT